MLCNMPARSRTRMNKTERKALHCVGASDLLRNAIEP
jgi:hypothetical protein